MGLSLVYPKKFRPGPVPIGSLINDTFSSLGDWTITSPAGHTQKASVILSTPVSNYK